MVSAALNAFGAVDILVANAGIVKAAPFLEMTEEVRCRVTFGFRRVVRVASADACASQDFDEVLRVNLKGVFLVSAHGAS